MSIVLVSESASFTLDNSMFVVDGNFNDGYTFNEDIFFMLGLKEHEDYSFVLHRLCVGGDIHAGKYEAFLHDDKQISDVSSWVYRSILNYLFKDNKQEYDRVRKEMKPADLLPELEDEFGFYMPNDVLEEFIVEFPMFKHINV
jgi:hypothetical protein